MELESPLVGRFIKKKSSFLSVSVGCTPFVVERQAKYTTVLHKLNCTTVVDYMRTKRRRVSNKTDYDT